MKVAVAGGTGVAEQRALDLVRAPGKLPRLTR
jgi:hypothetical protein